MTLWRNTLLAGAALSVAVIGGAAQAQVQTPGGFGSITGYYGFRGGHETDIVAGIGAVRPGRTLGGQVYGGYRFGDFDLAVGLSGGTLSTNSVTQGTINSTSSARFWVVDLEAGYNIAAGKVGIRPFIGARYANWRHNHGFTITGGGGGSPGSANVDTWGIGPRLGADVALRVAESVSLFAGTSGSVLFGNLSEYGSFGGGFPPPNQKITRTMINFDGKVGIAYEPVPLVSIALGYRVDYWAGVDLGTWTGLAGGPGSSRGHRVIHGPFVRLAYNIGAPGPVMAPPPPPDPAKQTSYMVFFDFDRSNITPTAATTIKQAATDAKAGQKTRIGVTGHADRSGSDAYNMALSLRRANAVKDQLVREGIPATGITITGRGESQPLVQTADGVREPQNRRVEIVLQ
jgi:hypothetical protein